MKIKLALMLLLAAGASTGYAADVTSTTTSFSSERNCFDNAAPCDQVSNTFASSVGGSPGGSSATSSLGSTSGNAFLNPAAGSFLMSGSSSAGPGLRFTTNDGVMAEYTYVGATAASMTFTGLLAYGQNLPATGSQFGGTSAYLDVFTLPGSSVAAGADATSNFNLLFNASSLPGYTDIGQDSFYDGLSGSNQVTESVTFTVNPGETFWAWALLQTPSTEGGTVNNSFFTNFSGPASGQLVSGSVPAPASSALLALGLLGIGFGARRKLAGGEGTSC